MIPAELIDRLTPEARVTVMTGAGTSAESGVPTFRDAQTGLWEKYRPEELATPQAFAKDPKLVWQWYQWRRDLVLSAEPNPGHRAVAGLARLFSQFQLVTQNVDGLHQRAGSNQVVELHGSLMRARCYRKNHAADVWPDDSTSQPPTCDSCGSWMRPDVVWFNESLPPMAIELASESAKNCDVYFSVGTSSVVYPAAAFAEMAKQHGALLVEINLDSTPLTDSADFVLPGPSAKLLPALLRSIQESRK